MKTSYYNWLNFSKTRRQLFLPLQNQNIFIYIKIIVLISSIKSMPAIFRCQAGTMLVMIFFHEANVCREYKV